MKSKSEVTRLRLLLEEALDWVTDKPWDDTSHLHKRISEELGLPVQYPDCFPDDDEDGTDN